MSFVLPLLELSKAIRSASRAIYQSTSFHTGRRFSGSGRSWSGNGDKRRPLTTTVMNAVPRDQAGTASGINNAVSRVASLLAVAVFGLMLYAEFNRSLDRRLDALSPSPSERQQIDQQRPKLAAAETSDPNVKAAINESFLAGYRVVVRAAVGLALASALTAFLLIRPAKSAEP